MSGLARETGAVDLGQGFPESDGPGDPPARRRCRDAQARTSIRRCVGCHICARLSPSITGCLQGLALDWKTEVTITSPQPKRLLQRY